MAHVEFLGVGYVLQKSAAGAHCAAGSSPMPSASTSGRKTAGTRAAEAMYSKPSPPNSGMAAIFLQKFRYVPVRRRAVRQNRLAGEKRPSSLMICPRASSPAKAVAQNSPVDDVAEGRAAGAGVRYTAQI